MNGLSRLDWVLLAIAALVAITSLVRLMRARRDHLIADVRQQLADEQARVRRQKKNDAA
ncbi:hypothetical protein Pla175_05390 [Pirellulimonas nuda]|uniref:Uncharacterized protein n=1 Tax=Pirellulimonas nuda TaxID=2528009 RepID=A0A518D6S5_9BACT|nr:hypothetical protein [Pirellulimonas nuda]QDU87183.1 hypothetical protein Pla175_05390 [Pirellulimonas nuda]